MTLTQSPPIVEAVRRRLEMDELPGPRSTVRAAFTLTTTLGQAPAQLWPMLSRLDRLAQWYGPVSGELREGGRLQLPGGVECRILEVEAPHKMEDRKSTRLNSSHVAISYAVFCLKKKKQQHAEQHTK